MNYSLTFEWKENMAKNWTPEKLYTKPIKQKSILDKIWIYIYKIIIIKGLRYQWPPRGGGVIFSAMYSKK